MLRVSMAVGALLARAAGDDRDPELVREPRIAAMVPNSITLPVGSIGPYEPVLMPIAIHRRATMLRSPSNMSTFRLKIRPSARSRSSRLRIRARTRPTGLATTRVELDVGNISQRSSITTGQDSSGSGR